MTINIITILYYDTKQSESFLQFIMLKKSFPLFEDTCIFLQVCFLPSALGMLTSPYTLIISRYMEAAFVYCSSLFEIGQILRPSGIDEEVEEFILLLCFLIKLIFKEVDSILSKFVNNLLT